MTSGCGLGMDLTSSCGLAVERCCPSSHWLFGHENKGKSCRAKLGVPANPLPMIPVPLTLKWQRVDSSLHPLHLSFLHPSFHQLPLHPPPTCLMSHCFPLIHSSNFLLPSQIVLQVPKLQTQTHTHTHIEHTAHIKRSKHSLTHIHMQSLLHASHAINSTAKPRNLIAYTVTHSYSLPFLWISLSPPPLSPHSLSLSPSLSLYIILSLRPDY